MTRLNFLGVALLSVCLVASARAFGQSTQPGATIRYPNAVVFELEEIRPPVAKSLDYVLAACSGRYQTCILVIRSDGGYVDEANAIVEVMQKYPNIRFIAYIRSAISAAIWPAIASEKVFIERGGAVGGAQIYYVDSQTGNYLVDGKFNSIQEAKVRAIAEKNGHPIGFVMSMMVPKKTGERTQMEYSRRVGFDYESVRIRVEKARVATYTASEAADAKFATLAERLSDVAPEYASTNRGLVDSLSGTLALTDQLSKFWFSELYTPDAVASRLRRETVETSKVITQRSGGLIANKKRVQGERMQNDQEYRASQQRVRGKVKLLLTQTDNLAKEVERFAASGRLAAFEVDEPRKQFDTKAFTGVTLSQRIKALQRQIEELGPMMLPKHRDAIRSEIEQVLSLCEQNR